MTKRAMLFLAIFFWLIICSIAHGSIGLTINGDNPVVSPLELKTNKSLEIGVVDSDSTETSYDLTLSATGGVFLCEDPTSKSTVSSKLLQNETVNIQTSDLGNIGKIYFEFQYDPGVAIISLTTNQALTINNQAVSAGTEIYQLVLFDMGDDKVAVFGINYDSLSYEPPVEEKSTTQSLEASSLESLDFGGESMMMSMGYQIEEPVWFDNPAQCPDLDNDDFVNFADYAVFAGNWLQTGSGLAGDFDEDGSVDVDDLIHFCEYWLTPVDCPEYYADALPYQCSFEPSQGFVSTTDPNNPASLDYQAGWQVSSGIAELYETYYPSGQYLIFYNYVWLDPNTVIAKDFISNETDDTYIRTSIVSNQGAEILLMNDSNSIVAGLKFGGNNHYEVYDNGNYSSTASTWQAEYWIDLMFVMNYSSNNYDVYYYDWGSESYVQIGNDIDFDGSYSTINRVEYHTANLFSAVDKLSITDYSTAGGTFGESGTINITSPCACDTDDPLKGKVPVIGSVWWESLGDYVISCCPYDLDHTDKENWVEVARGDSVVDNDVLGHWNTDRIPNGYYYLRLDVRPDYDVWNTYTSSWVNTYAGSWIYKTLSIGGTVVYDDLGYFPVVGDLKSNTFYHEEQPDISVPWAGQFPFEFRRTFNNNRKFYSKPLYDGWTHNSQIKLIEDTRYDWNLNTTALPVPDYDEQQLGMGYIWLEMPDGSKKLFTCETENVQGRYSTITYKPFHDDNGEYIERTSYVDLYMDWEFDVYYTLYQRDGTELDFRSTGNSLDGIYSLTGGIVGWKVEMGISTMSDRFGNTLSYNWRYDSGKPVAVSTISGAGKQIVFTFDNNDRYTKAELKAGSTVYRTLEFDIEDPNDGTVIYSVTKKGKGVNEQGVYDGINDKEYVTKYQYDSGHNLRKIININTSSQDETLIEVDYDNYGRVDARRDYVEADNYLETTYDYIFIDPNLPGGSGDRLITTQSTDSRTFVTVQNDKGAALSQQITPSDACAVTNTNLDYTDFDNSLKPTDIYETFDGLERYTWNDYDDYGDLVEQQIYVDDSNYIATELTYHLDYALETSKTSWQGLNKTGPKVQKLSIYGNADGTESPYGSYLVAEKVLLDDGGSGDPNDDVWAITRYKYHDTGNKKGLVKEIADPEGFVTLFEYDDNGYKTFVSKGDDPNNTEIVERYQYDAIGQLVLEANPLGGVTRHDYDGFGRLYRTRKYEDLAVMYRTEGQFDPNQYDQTPVIAESWFGYDEQGFKTFEKLETDGEVDTTFTFNGLPKRKTLDDGSFLEFDYDSRGNKTQEYRYEYATQNDWYVTFGYDSMNRLTQANWFDYNDSTLVKSQTTEYYGTGKKKLEQFFGYGGMLEKTVGYGYDILTRMASTTTDPGGLSLSTGYAYDAAGNRISTTDPKGNILYADYDNANRRITEYFAAAGGTEHEDAVLSKQIDYYTDGKVFSSTRFDYNGSTTLAYSEFAYDARGRLTQAIQQIDAQNDAVSDYYYFDASADPNDPNTTAILASIIIEDAEEKQTVITLDSFGRQLKRLYPSDDYEEYQYNGEGTLWKKAVWDDQGAKQWIEYGYDGYGRMTDMDYPDSGTVDYTYDGFGRKLLVEDDRNTTDNIGGDHQVSYTYDVLGRTETVTDQDGYITTYTYRHDNQKQSIIVEEPGPTKIYDVQYMFDSANRLEYAKDGFQTDPISGYIAKLGYDDNGNRDVLHYYPSGSLMGSTVDIGCTYNRDNYLTNYTTTGGPTFIFDADDSGDIDGLGRLISADETITQVGGSTVNHSYTYSYDMLSRLKYAYTSNVAPTAYREYDYEYDKAGNMTHSVFDNGGGFEHHTYYQLDGDQVTGTTGTAGNKYLTWDDNGRQTSRYGNSAGDYPIGYNWDGKAISSNEHVDPNMGIEVKYTPDGMRIWKKFKWNLASYEHKYIVDSVGDVPQVLLIIDANDVNGTILETLVHANGQVVMQYDGDHTASRYFYLHDRLGSVRAIIDSSAAIQNCYFYTPWGSVTGSETAENVDNWYAWAGYWYEDGMENGLSATYYCDARHYSSGRFLTRDPVRGKFSEPMTLHQYLYCMNDPINRIDPTGEFFGFLGSMWARGKNAAASITAEKWAEETIIGAASVWNGLTQGYLNVLFGPGDMSDKAKFWVGFVGGFGEMQVGMRTGSAALGATVASTFTSAANSALSESTEFISIGTAVNIGLSAAMGAFGDWAADGLDPFTLWAIGVDAAMAGGLGQMGYEYTYGD